MVDTHSVENDSGDFRDKIDQVDDTVPVGMVAVEMVANKDVDNLVRGLVVSY